MSHPTGRPAEPVRIVRVIARLNIGGPAIQAITLTARMRELGYTTVLVRGQEEPDEGNMDDLAAELGVNPVSIRWLRRNPGAWDLPALVALVRLLRRERPHVVHTHAAKGGTLGRVATVIAFPRRRSRPVVVHTYHGHSLAGYFSPQVTAVYRMIEKVLARCSDRLISVSDEVRDDLIGFGVAPGERFDVVRLGFDLAAFTATDTIRATARGALRAELGIPRDALVVTLVARLVPIKRVDRFLKVALLLRDLPNVHFLIVGDGLLRESLRASADARRLDQVLTWAGYRRDMPSVYFCSDAVVQTSDNEGTPVALIEAQAAGVPVVSTAVGGTATVVGDRTALKAPDDIAGIASLVRAALTMPGPAARTRNRANQDRVLKCFDFNRLVDETARVYERALASRNVDRGEPRRQRPAARPIPAARRLSARATAGFARLTDRLGSARQDS